MQDNVRKANLFSFQSESFHAGCDKNAAWRKHSSYSAPLHLSALILSCCQSQRQAHAKRGAHRHLQQTYKRGLQRWTYLTDWLFSLSSFPMSLCSIHSHSSSNTWRWKRDSRGFAPWYFGSSELIMYEVYNDQFSSIIALFFTLSEKKQSH